MDDNSNEAVSILLDNYSKAIHSVLTGLARQNDIPENWNTIVTLRLAESDLFHIQRIGCYPSTIYVNASIIATLKSASKELKGRFQLAAIKAIKLAANLSASGTALITGDIAYAITESRKRLRRSVIAASYNALDDRYITVGGTFRLTDRLSGRIIEVPINNFLPIDAQLQAAKRQLSLDMLQDAETEEVIDLIETSRNFVASPNPTNYTIALEAGGITTNVGYTHIQLDEHD